ncbi:hypothetical protein LJR225_005191 [Phenylobacterium sp. LjRoot225]|uniref:hypothetical protein n=1 Tax=Phenylobacterium sp. LjRoot225 TaxID=3342285 RepID=UPI003ED15BBF
MTNRSFTALSALALALSIAASAAHAQPYGKGGNYNVAPSSASSAQDEHKSHMRQTKCDCSMMKSDGAMRDQCMSMMSGHRGETAQPGQAG